MTPDEVRDLARLATSAATGVVDLVEHTHDGVVDRVYGAVGVLTAGASHPVRLVHRAIGRQTFGWVRRGLAAGGWAAQALAPRVAGDDRDDGGTTGLAGRRTQLALGILNGVSGDRLAHEGSTLALPLTLRQDGRDIPATRAGLEAAYGDTHDRLVVFLHGLVETEHAWRFRSRQRWGEAGTSYASRLREETDWMPLLVRYNTGLPIEDNAAALGELLTQVMRSWPRPPRELVLVGHSMGGLVALWAIAQGDPDWTGTVRAVVTVGSPREGAPLERFAVVAEELAESSGAGRWLGGLIGLRSNGIRDLRHPVAHPPLPPSVREYAVHASLTPGSWHPRVPRIGDGLVPVPAGAERPEDGIVVPGLHHLDLLNHPTVYAQLREWLDAG